MGAQSNQIPRIPIVSRKEKEVIMASLTDHKIRIEKLEANDRDLEYIANTIKKIWRAIKVGGPTVLAYLVGTGWLGKDVADGLKAVLGL